MSEIESEITAVTAPDGSISLRFRSNCKLIIEMNVDGEGTKTLDITAGKAIAKELLLILHAIYGMEHYEVNSRFTQEQFEFLSQLADINQMTIEDVLRQLVQTQIDNQSSI